MTLLRVQRGHQWRTATGAIAEAPDVGYLVLGDDGERVFLPADAPLRANAAVVCPSCHMIGCAADHSCACSCGLSHRGVVDCPHFHGAHPAHERRVCQCNCLACLPSVPSRRAVA